MQRDTKSPAVNTYVTAVEYEYSGMINALTYLCQEARAAHLDLVTLHLKIAIAELKEYRLPFEEDDPS